MSIGFGLTTLSSGSGFNFKAGEGERETGEELLLCLLEERDGPSGNSRPTTTLVGDAFRLLTGVRDLDRDLLLLREYGLRRNAGLLRGLMLCLLLGLLVRLRLRPIGDRLLGDRERFRGVRERERVRDLLRIGDLSLVLPFFALSSAEFFNSSA